jgi:rRNA maturation RNase YbeY
VSLDKITTVNNYGNIDLSAISILSLVSTHADLGIKKPVIYYFVRDDEMLRVNKENLGHDTYTDIITFDYEEDIDIEHNEVLISWDRVLDNAKTFKKSIKNELHRVCIHGLLHLAGHNDRSNKEKQKMRALEDKYLNLYCST